MSSSPEPVLILLGFPRAGAWNGNCDPASLSRRSNGSSHRWRPREIPPVLWRPDGRPAQQTSQAWWEIQHRRRRRWQTEVFCTSWYRDQNSSDDLTLCAWTRSKSWRQPPKSRGCATIARPSRKHRSTTAIGVSGLGHKLTNGDRSLKVGGPWNSPSLYSTPTRRWIDTTASRRPSFAQDSPGACRCGISRAGSFAWQSQMGDGVSARITESSTSTRRRNAFR